MLGMCSVPILNKNQEFLGLHQESAILGANLEILDAHQERFLVKTAFLTMRLSKHSPVNDALLAAHLKIGCPSLAFGEKWWLAQDKHR
jgi:hypothetical protein